jgi:hypothetical protein
MVHLARAYLLAFFVAGAAFGGEVDGIITGGGSAFLDGPTHSVVGGSLRFYMNDRLAVEPEYLYMRGSANDQDHVGVANLLYHFKDSDAPVSPFAIGGVGIFNHRDRSFETNGAEALLGGGVRINITDRVFFEPRVRLGVQDVNLSFTGSLGIVLGGR